MPEFNIQHPVITNMEETGYPDGKEPDYPHCPVCGEECETIYFGKDHEIVGCDCCCTTAEAWEVEACFPSREKEDDE